MMGTAERTAAYGWRPDDYIVHGRHCDTAALTNALSDLRRRCQASAALLLVFRERTLFQSLLLIAHRDPEGEGARLQEALVRQPALELLRSEEPLSSLGDRVSARDWLSRMRARAPLRAIAELLSGDIQLVCRPAADPPSRSAGVCVVLVDSEEPTDADHALVDLLHLMANATSSVVVHRDIAPEQALDRVVREIETTDAELRYEEVLLEAARRITRSALGTFYLATRERGTLELAATRSNASAIPKVRATAANSVPAYVYLRQRALLINDLRDFRAMHPKIAFLSETESPEAGFARLAAPVLQSLPSSSRTITLGVLDMEKTDRAEGYYTDTDLQLLNLVAERYVAWRLRRLLLLSVGTFEQITRRSVQPTAVDALGDLPVGPALHLPADLWPAKGAVDHIVRSLYDLTRSDSVTVRLITTDQQRLQRLSAYPPERMADVYARITLDNDRSVNAYVARTGTERYITDFHGDFRRPDDPPRLGHAQARPAIRAELSLPIVLEDRVVGTLNLESQLPGGFDETHEIIRAVAQQVALALSRARRMSEQVVFSMTSASTANVHELGKHARQLRKKAAKDTALKPIVTGIERCLRQEAAEVDAEALAISVLIDEIVRSRKWGSVVSANLTGHTHVIVSGAHRLPVRYALETLMHNAIEHQDSLDQFIVSISAARQSFGGRDYLTLTIVNPIRDSVPLDIVPLLYRQPIPEGHGLHIGAFTAAAGIRAIGGDVYAESLRPPEFAVKIDIPLLAQVDTAP